MKTHEFLNYLHGLGVELRSRGENLICNAPKGVLTTELNAVIREKKSEILVFLQETKVLENSHSHRIVKRNRQSPLPLSFAQQRLWFLDQLEPGSSVYNIPVAFRLTGRLDTGALDQSLNEVIRRHEALRTTFSVVDDQPVQVVAPSLTLKLEIVDIRDVPEGEREVEVERLTGEEAHRSFDLGRGPLFRASLLKLGEAEHVLLLSMHHIVSDGWSMGVLYSELSQLYEAFHEGKTSSLPDLPVQYGDFAIWQRQWLQGGVLDKQLTYWKERLEGATAVLELPTDRPRPPVQTYRGGRQSFVLPKSVTEGLKVLSRKEGISLFMVLLGAFQVLLYRYTGQEDIVVGSPIANRTREEVEGLIGFFVNTLVLRTDLSGDPSFRAVLKRVREVALGAYDHQDVPFEKLVDELQPERDPSHTPLFQVMFVLQNMPSQPIDLKELTVSPLALNIETVMFDLTLGILEDRGDVTGSLEYNSDLFGAGTVARMVGHYERVLEGIVAELDASISELPLLTEAESYQLVEGWNDTALDYPRERCVHELFEAQVVRRPDAIAVAGNGMQLTYRELNDRANQLAHYLQDERVGSEVFVGVYMERSPEMLVGLLGILKAGGAYVPLDPAHPGARLAFMMKESGMGVLLTQGDLVDTLPAEGMRVICLDRDWPKIAQGSMGNPISGTAMDDLAYLIYTSGSTGQPKGIQVEHGSLLNLVFWHQRAFGVSASDRATQVAGPAFDASVWELWPYLSAGASIHIPDDETRGSAEGLRDWLVAEEISISFLPTPLAEIMLSLEWPSEVALRSLLTGGDKLHQRPGPGLPFELVNNYGPTENTVVTTSGVVAPVDGSQGVPSIGRPIANVQTYVLDRYLKPVPIGVTGELCIGGQGLARGYLNDPDLTKEKFIPNPFSDDPGSRLYKTGDMVRYLPDGDIEFLGRIDHQVKIRGFRIELGEIELVLNEYPEVQESVVLAREDVPGSAYLVAYVIPSEGAVPLVKELRDFLKKKLPEYMVPSAFMMLESFPLTPNGKIDRKALPIPDAPTLHSEVPHVKPRDALELQLTEIWERLLGVEPIGIKDNFFELGGHSLLAAQLFSKMERVVGKKLPLAMLFQAPTVEKLAAILRDEGWSPSWSSLVPIQPKGSRPPFFCIHAHGGNVVGYRDLARHLGTDQPFYGLQAQGLNGEPAGSRRIEDMAAHYVQEIRKVQSRGPYFIGGWCFGGIVAFEMAQLLQSRGEEVALLAMIDIIRPNYPRLFPGTTAFQRLVNLIITRVDHEVSTFLNVEPKAMLSHYAERFGRLVKKNQKSVRRMIGPSAIEPDFRGEHFPMNPLEDSGEVNFGMYRDYEPHQYQGKATIFKASQQPFRVFLDRTLGWGELIAGGLEVIEVPGPGAGILEEPRVRILAEQLGACIDKAQMP